MICADLGVRGERESQTKCAAGSSPDTGRLPAPTEVAAVRCSSQPCRRHEGSRHQGDCRHWQEAGGVRDLHLQQTTLLSSVPHLLLPGVPQSPQRTLQQARGLHHRVRLSAGQEAEVRLSPHTFSLTETRRRRVRFCDSGDFQITDQILYPLEQEIMDRMSAIKLDQAVWTGNTNKDTTVEKLSDTVNGMAITENTFQ